MSTRRPLLAIVDHGMGNLRSVEKAFAHIGRGGVRIAVTSDPEVVGRAERVVVPGQGAIGDCMRALEAGGLRESVLEAARNRPFLGICIGMQALMERSEENEGTPGLALIEGRVRRFAPDARDPGTGERLKVPHMGWNRVRQVRSHPLWSGIPDETRFYFVHSYYVMPRDAGLRAGVTTHGVEFTSALARENLFAVQFHPEKSQRPGLRLLENFLAWRP